MRGRRLFVGGLVMTGVLAVGQTALAERDPYPHEFHRNMGYCAPYLAQLRSPNGDPVRPFINRAIHELTRDGDFEGYKNVGGLYSARARSTDDQNCLPR
jgi:hypothetical protein